MRQTLHAALVLIASTLGLLVSCGKDAPDKGSGTKGSGPATRPRANDKLVDLSRADLQRIHWSLSSGPINPSSAWSKSFVITVDQKKKRLSCDHKLTRYGPHRAFTHQRIFAAARYQRLAKLMRATRLARRTEPPIRHSDGVAVQWLRFTIAGVIFEVLLRGVSNAGRYVVQDSLLAEQWAKLIQQLTDECVKDLKAP